ncbi:hypothetical protein [Aquimonas voraii]|uniref:Uncharacterized protein n=1 Tax=Aquimonas voraii TaxID=265719 RepID=A0A1G6ZPU8_9GAMM|nr:hypothetical protein [Aquimonas voraii]SDE04708.1 hypothetical protein SAMN04488509_11529 [Aquimonas voraii]
MLRKNVALALSTLLLANTAAALDFARIDHERLEAQTRALVEIQALTERPGFAVAPSKEFTGGCVTEPFPVQPTGPKWTVRASDVAGAQMEITAWRRPCGTAGDAQLFITVSPVSGTPFAPCRVTMVQNNVQYSSLLRTNLPSNIATTALCGNLFTPTTAYVISTGLSPAFDDDQASTLFFDLAAIPTPVRLDIPAYNAADYGAPPPALSTVRRQMAGAWNTEGMGNQGFYFDIDESARILAVAWFTGTPDGRARDWYSALGTFTGPRVQLTVYRTEDVAFARQTTVNTQPFGTMTMDFAACDRATVSWSLNDGRSGSLPIRKVLPVIPAC